MEKQQWEKIPSATLARIRVRMPVLFLHRSFGVYYDMEICKKDGAWCWREYLRSRI